MNGTGKLLNVFTRKLYVLISYSLTAVSVGAVMRAANLKNGPERRADSNIGFLRIEPFQPGNIKGHREATPFRDEHSGELYVKVIDYFILLVRYLACP